VTTLSYDELKTKVAEALAALGPAPDAPDPS